MFIVATFVHRQFHTQYTVCSVQLYEGVHVILMSPTSLSPHLAGNTHNNILLKNFLWGLIEEGLSPVNFTRHFSESSLDECLKELSRDFIPCFFLLRWIWLIWTSYSYTNTFLLWLSFAEIFACAKKCRCVIDTPEYKIQNSSLISQDGLV